MKNSERRTGMEFNKKVTEGTKTRAVGYPRGETELKRELSAPGGLFGVQGVE
jgi:hypothetical protein